MGWPVLAQDAGSEAASIIGALLGLGLLVWFFAGLWRVFEKAGESGWKALIPIYQIYVLCKIAGRSGWWLVLWAVPLVGYVANFVVLMRLSRLFGRGPLLGVGMSLLPVAFVPILGFSSARYQGLANAPAADQHGDSGSWTEPTALDGVAAAAPRTAILWVIAFVFVSTAAALAQLFLDAYRTVTIGGLVSLDGEQLDLSVAAYDAATATSAVFAGLDVLAVLIAGMVFLVWLGRILGYFERVGIKGRRSRAWAIGGWFVPFANLVVPYRVMGDVSRSSRHLAEGAESDAWESQPVPRPLGWWWAAYLLGVFTAGLASITYDFDVDSLEEFVSSERLSASLDLAADVFWVAAGVLFIVMLRSIFTDLGSAETQEGRPPIAPSVAGPPG